MAHPFPTGGSTVQKCNRNSVQTVKRDAEIKKRLAFSHIGRYCGPSIALAALVDVPSLAGCVWGPNCSIAFLKNKHFPSLNGTTPLEAFSVRCIGSRCPSTDLEKMMIWSRHAGTNCHLTVDSIMSVAPWNVPGVFFEPKVIL